MVAERFQRALPIWHHVAPMITSSTILVLPYTDLESHKKLTLFAVCRIIANFLPEIDKPHFGRHFFPQTLYGHGEMEFFFGTSDTLHHRRLILPLE